MADLEPLLGRRETPSGGIAKDRLRLVQAGDRGGFCRSDWRLSRMRLWR